MRRITPSLQRTEDVGFGFDLNDFEHDPHVAQPFTFRFRGAGDGGTPVIFSAQTGGRGQIAGPNQGELTFIQPNFWETDYYPRPVDIKILEKQILCKEKWIKMMSWIEGTYLEMIEAGAYALLQCIISSPATAAKKKLAVDLYHDIVATSFEWMRTGKMQRLVNSEHEYLHYQGHALETNQ